MPSTMLGPGNTTVRKKSWDFPVTHTQASEITDRRALVTVSCLAFLDPGNAGHLPGRWTRSLQLGAPHCFSSQSHLCICSPWAV